MTNNAGLLFLVQIEIRQGGERSFFDFPGFEQREDCLHGKSRADQAADDAVGFFFIGRLAEPFALDITAGQFLFRKVGVGGVKCLADEFAVNAALGEVLLHAAAAEFFVLLTHAGEIGGVARVIEIVLLGEPENDGLHFGVARLAGFHAQPHQAFEFGNGAHFAAQAAHGILIERGGIEGLAFFRLLSFTWSRTISKTAVKCHGSPFPALMLQNGTRAQWCPRIT